MQMRELQPFGIEVELDLATASREQMAKIMFLTAKHIVVLVRDQGHLNTSQYAAACRLAALHSPQGTWANRKDHPDVIRVTNKIVDSEGRMGWFKDGELEWHCSGIMVKDSEEGIALRCLDRGDTGGDTWFTDGKNAFLDLNKEEQNYLATLSCSYHFYNQVSNGKGVANFTEFEVQQFGKLMSTRARPGTEGSEDSYYRDPNSVQKKLVIEHPLSMEKGFFFPWTMISGFVGLSDTESDSLYRHLKAHCLKDKYVYKHEWREGDVLFSDQLHSLHRREPFTGVRELQRMAYWYDYDVINNYALNM